jgi:hypothetical protein
MAGAAGFGAGRTLVDAVDAEPDESEGAAVAVTAGVGAGADGGAAVAAFGAWSAGFAEATAEADGASPAPEATALGAGCELGSALGAWAAEALAVGASAALAELGGEGSGAGTTAAGCTGSGGAPKSLSRLIATAAIATTTTAPITSLRLELRAFGAGVDEAVARRGESPPSPFVPGACPGESAATIPRAAAPWSAAFVGTVLGRAGGPDLTETFDALASWAASLGRDCGESPVKRGFVPTSSIDPPASRRASSRSSAACFMTVCSCLGACGDTLADFGKRGDGAMGRGAVDGDDGEEPERGLGTAPPAESGDPGL